jgi:hypothetical protein
LEKAVEAGEHQQLLIACLKKTAGARNRQYLLNARLEKASGGVMNDWTEFPYQKKVSGRGRNSCY